MSLLPKTVRWIKKSQCPWYLEGLATPPHVLRERNLRKANLEGQKDKKAFNFHYVLTAALAY
jgi:hypothetical protein